MVTRFVEPDGQAQDIGGQTFDAHELAQVSPRWGQFVISNLRIREHACLTGVNQTRLRRLPSKEFAFLHAHETTAALAGATIMHQLDTLQEGGVEQQIARVCGESLSVRNDRELFGHCFWAPMFIAERCQRAAATGGRAFGPNRFAAYALVLQNPRPALPTTRPTPKVFKSTWQLTWQSGGISRARIHIWEIS
jgi:hypothetical protein